MSEVNANNVGAMPVAPIDPNNNAGRAAASLLPEPGAESQRFVGMSPPPQPQPEAFDPNKVERVGGNLTRAGAEHLIRNGMSAVIGGKIYSRIADLPSQAQLNEYHAAHAAEVAAHRPVTTGTIGAAVTAALAGAKGRPAA